MENKKRLLINIASNIISFFVQLGISFFLTPIITNKVGTDAYGFIGLSNNFVSYANIFTVIINSMASRFITYELMRGKTKEANKYFSSVFYMDVIMSVIVLIINTLLVINITRVLNVPEHLVKDVKITFALSGISLVISIMSTIFTIATYVKNRLDIDAIRNIIGNILKAIVLIILFSFLPPKIYYIMIGGLVFSTFIFAVNIRITKRLAPELTISKKYFDKKYIWKLTKSGIWNSINNFSKVLLTGLDLLIANLFIGATDMGNLSIAKTIPTTIENLMATIVNVFGPEYINYYSKHQIRRLVGEVNFSMKLVALIMIVPITGFIAFGESFFRLWLTSKTDSEIAEIQILSVLSLLPFAISVCNYTLFVLDTTTNKLKRPVIATLIMSIASVVTTIILLKTTNLGLYAIAGVSSFYWVLKTIFFNTINAAKNLRINRFTFFRQFGYNFICLLVTLILFLIISKFLVLNTWKKFLIVVVIVGICGYILDFMMLLDKEEKRRLISKFKTKIIIEFLKQKNYNK